MPLPQVREMVEIITKEFILMGGTVDVVRRAGCNFLHPHHAGQAVLCAQPEQCSPPVDPSAAELVPMESLP